MIGDDYKTYRTSREAFGESFKPERGLDPDAVIFWLCAVVGLVVIPLIAFGVL